MQITNRLLQALNNGTTKDKMVYYRPKISRTCPHDTTFIYKPKEATNPTKMGLLSLRLPLYMLYKVWTCQQTRTYISITSNILFRSLSVTFSPTYSFDVLVEAFVDTATPRLCWVFNLLLQLQCASWLPAALRCCFWVVEPFDLLCCFNSPMTLWCGVGWVVLILVDSCESPYEEKNTILTTSVSQIPHAAWTGWMLIGAFTSIVSQTSEVLGHSSAKFAHCLFFHLVVTSK